MDKRFDHNRAQEQLKSLWEKERVYAQENNPGTLYSIDTPPPTVSGSLHIGHIFSYTQTDILARYKRMNGFSVFYPFGFDDNGLPTERYVEKRRKIKAHQVGRSEFIKICLEETAQAADQFKQLWQSMGLSADWQDTYSTISESSRKISQESFLRLLEKGYIYRDKEPALYCVSCRTSVAQAELDDLEQASTFNDIIFKDQEGNDLLIGTTRPELLGSCVALFYHPNDPRYSDLNGKKAVVPVFGHIVPILEDDSVDPEKGTGLVMCCTFGDKTDIHWYKKHNLPYRQTIGLNGKMTELAGELAGLSVAQARTMILKELDDNGLLLKQRPIAHAVNVHERCKKEIEFVMLSQWFLNILDHKQTFLDLADRIEWHPAFMKSRYIDWVQNLSWNWCLSRQRLYGIPFPVWHCNDCNAILVPEFKDLPIDPQETGFPGGACTRCKSINITPDTDVMDTWNTSSITPYICFNLLNPTVDSVFANNEIKNYLPMSMRPQAHDIIRTWAFYTIIKTWMHHDMVPWHDIVISGHVLSDGKEKLSKSKDNSALSPENLLERYPADVIRYWTASGRLGHDVAFSENQLKIGIRLVTKLWNAFRFVQEHIKPIEQAPSNLGVVNEWLIDAASTTFTTFQKHLEENEFSLALSAIESFFWHDFCDNYLELIKNQLFNPDEYAPDHVAATQWTLYQVGLRILQMYAPYLPYVTDALYQEVYASHREAPSVHMTKFAGTQAPYVFKESAKIMQAINYVVSQVRKLKTNEQLSLKTELKILTIHAEDPALIATLKEHEQLIKGVTQALELHFKDTDVAESRIKEIDGFWHATVRTKE